MNYPPKIYFHLFINLILNFLQIYAVNDGDINNRITNTNKSQDNNCRENSDLYFLCQTTQIFRNIVKLLKDPNNPLVLMPGLELVSSLENDLNSDARSGNNIDENSNNLDTFFDRLLNYLKSHELKVKFSNLVHNKDIKEALTTLIRSVDEEKYTTAAEGRKKDKGMGLVMIMGLMMAKMMTTLGLGGIGALAMKALGVSLMALLLSGIIGLKSLAGGGNDHGEHHVQYITAHEGHHRKRREIGRKSKMHFELGGAIPYSYRDWKY